jgi:DNA invertase Pin-like site-specific DNA recombinase
MAIIASRTLRKTLYSFFAVKSFYREERKEKIRKGAQNASAFGKSNGNLP